MTDERITYEPRTENGKHYVIATAKLGRINPQMADGRDRLGAAEALCSLLIDLCDVLFEDEQKATERVQRLQAVAEAAKPVLKDLEAAIDTLVDCGEVHSRDIGRAIRDRLSAALAALEAKEQ